jgi:hypothetical protein
MKNILLRFGSSEIESYTDAEGLHLVVGDEVAEAILDSSHPEHYNTLSITIHSALSHIENEE